MRDPRHAASSRIPRTMSLILKFLYASLLVKVDGGIPSCKDSCNLLLNGICGMVGGRSVLTSAVAHLLRARCGRRRSATYCTVRTLYYYLLVGNYSTGTWLARGVKFISTADLAQEDPSDRRTVRGTVPRLSHRCSFRSLQSPRTVGASTRGNLTLYC